MSSATSNSEIPLLRAVNICKSFPGIKALQKVDLDLLPGTIHALLGENGAGKSTLINILSGLLSPDQGKIYFLDREVTLSDPARARQMGIAIAYQEGELFQDMSTAENVAWAQGWPGQVGLINWRRLRRQTAAALSNLDCLIDPDCPGSALTTAGRALVAIGAALSQNTSILILDEPTSSLSDAESCVLFDRLRQFRARGGAILYVSHRLEEIFKLADSVTVLRDGRLIWSGPLQKTEPNRLITLMVGRETQSRLARNLCLTGPVRLACRGLTALDGSFRDVTLQVHAGEILGLYGLVGAGRTDWAKAVFGIKPVGSGEVLLDGQPWLMDGAGQAARRGLAYLPEDRLRQGLCPTLSVRANTVLASLRQFANRIFVARSEETLRALTTVKQLTIRLRSIDQPAKTLSGGNQQKVVLGRWLLCQPRTLMLDEPTRGVDVGAKVEIHGHLRRLAEAGLAIVLISSDLAEVQAQSDRIGIFRDGRLVSIHDTSTITSDEIARLALPLGTPLSEDETGSHSQIVAKHSRVVLWARSLREAGLLLAALLLTVLLSWSTTTFWQLPTLRDIAENAGILALSGLGAALVILAGGIDISFGAIMALSAALCGHLMREGMVPLAAVILGLGTGALAGGANAALSLLGRVHPIVVTLGTMTLYRGLTLILIGARAIHDVPAEFRAPMQMYPLGVPAIAWLAIGGIAFTYGLLGWTISGRKILALGSNPAVAQRASIHRGRVWLAVFALQGLLAALAGLLALGRAGHLQGTDFEDMSLQAIGVAVVGGIAITGGRGSVWGVAAAALLFRILEKGWVLMRISNYWQQAIVGILLLLAILSDNWWRQASKKS